MASHDDRAIMQRTRSVENTDQQVIAELGVELHTAVSHILQTNVAFDHDERAGLRRGERRRSEHDFVVNAFAKLSAMPRERHAKSIAKTNQCLANLRLKQHDDRD